ncbi:MAG: hypothetical protein PHY47_16045 [Lachnospiraceae bacterium]|nr:hypothetical protein [Lachnospiraceae bacterium]
MKKKKKGPDPIDEFMRSAREQGLTYAQLQVKETCEMIRIQDRRKKLKEEKAKRGSVEPLF